MYADVEHRRRSPSITMTRLPFIARLTAVFMVMNVLPEPGLKEVIIITLPDVLDVRNPRLVRSTRKASLMTLRLPCCTTILDSLRSPFLGLSSGISPRNGMVRFSMSLRPRMRVLEVSRRYVTPNGSIRPMANAMRIILSRTGAVGEDEPVGRLIISVL